MKAITQVFKDLMTPDDQEQSWYYWACNQMAHAFLGALVAVLFGSYWLISVLLVACIKEFFDLLKKFNRRAVIDSLNDILFWVCGAGIVADYQNKFVYIMIVLCLICFGVYNRVKGKK